MTFFANGVERQSAGLVLRPSTRTPHPEERRASRRVSKERHAAQGEEAQDEGTAIDLTQSLSKGEEAHAEAGRTILAPNSSAHEIR